MMVGVSFIGLKWMKIVYSTSKGWKSPTNSIHFRSFQHATRVGTISTGKYGNNKTIVIIYIHQRGGLS